MALEVKAIPALFLAILAAAILAGCGSAPVAPDEGAVAGPGVADDRGGGAGEGVIDPLLEERLAAAGPGEKIAAIATLARRELVLPGEGVPVNERRLQVQRALRGIAAETLAPFEAFLEARGAEFVVPLWLAGALAFAADAPTIRDLARLEGVAAIRLDEVLAAPQPLAAAPSAAEWNLSAVRAQELWAAGPTGIGAVVAIMDTGVDPAHPDLSGRWRGGANSWFDPAGEYTSPHDRAGHGTQAAGIAVGGSASGTAIGVAPGASWIGVKIYSDAGIATLGGIHQGFQWLLDPDGDPATDDAPDVVGTSWGMRSAVDACIPEFHQDIALLAAAGIAVVASAGNEGPLPGTSISPANDPSAFSVGALDELLGVAPFSSRGPSACDGSIFPAIAAPGVNVRTADLTAGGAFPNSYAFVSGTSFASAHAVGAVALLAAAFPGIGVEALLGALRQGAAELGAAGLDNDSGSGLLDVVAAHDLLSGSVVCTDADGDGFFASAGCAAARDCDDLDPAVHPGAAESPFDGIDQDCNGYDLTIAASVRYVWRTDALNVVARSDLGRNAFLEVVGAGPMRWSESRKRFELSIAPTGGDPGSLRIAGVEGEIEVQSVRTRGAAPVPLPPEGLGASAVAAGVELAWTDASQNEAGFEIERAYSAAGPFVVIGTAGRNAIAAVDRSARAGIAYHYRVRAFHSGGSSLPSNVVAIVLP